MDIITSKNNNKIKNLIKIRDNSKFRNEESLFYVEGERIINDADIKLINGLFVAKSKFEQFKTLLDKFDKEIINIVDDDIFDKVKDTVNSQGIIATVKYNNLKNLRAEDLKGYNRILILDGVNDPGNLGTIIRLSEASNVDLIILTDNCCNIYNTKVIRACMGSIFRSNIYISNNILDVVSKIKQSDFKIYSTSLNDKSIKYTEINYKNRLCLVLGNEANGVSEKLLNVSDETIIIPMCGKIESLNVSIASAIILYEVMKQNNFYEDK